VSPRVLLVDDEANIRKMVAALLESEGFETAEAANGTAGIAEVERDAPDAVLLDLMMPGGPDGLATLEQLKRVRPSCRCDDERQGEPRRRGAGDQTGRLSVPRKAVDARGLLTTLRAALQLSRTLAENRRLHEALGHADRCGREQDNGAAARADRAGGANRSARADHRGIGHRQGARRLRHSSAERARDQAIRVRQQRGIPKDLVESEMFGHERGAIHRRHRARVGRFELADRGTLFLDEVGDLGPEAQAKLLRVLESGVIERLGAEKPVTVDVRVIAATNKDLAKASQQGQFREDLLFRLNVLPIHISPLRSVPTTLRRWYSIRRPSRRRGSAARCGSTPAPCSCSPLTRARQRARAGQHHGAARDPRRRGCRDGG